MPLCLHRSLTSCSICVNNFNVTILFITHSLAAARYLCERIAVMYKGNLMETGPADDVLKNPKHPYTQALIDALPKIREFERCKSIRYTSSIRACPIRTHRVPFFPEM